MITQMVRKQLWRLVCLAGAAAFTAAQPVKFNRDVRPIMSDTCFRCHGPDQKSRMAGLRLDLRAEAVKATKSGVTPIVPGDPDKSAIITRVFSPDRAKVMPPEYAHKELSEGQKNTLRRWVAEGANYEGHWAYEPLIRPTPPDVPEGSVRNAIDAFVQDRLMREGLKPSPEADRRTLLRRVTLDLTGIPPTPAESRAFVNDKSADAYDKVVARLLESPRYAEMQTMRWLDAVRYGDSAGFHGDNLWPAWPYRDYVLNAFRNNMPFDQFTREQIAGDLLPKATTQQKIAAAYNRMNRVSAEGGLQPKEYLAKYGADRVRTTTTVWMGATMGCAECHDHKFDPFTSKDFYSMKAFFADIKETGLVPDRGVRAWGSKLMLATDEQKARLKQIDADIKQARKALATKTKALEEARWAWEDRILAAHKNNELAWRYQRPITAAASAAKLTIFNDEAVESNFYLNGSLAGDKGPGEGLVVASGPNPDNETYVVTFKPGAGMWTAFGIDVIQDESLPGNRLSRGADRFVLSEVEAEVFRNGDTPRKLSFALATSNAFGEHQENPAMAAIDGDSKTGWGVGFGEARNQFLALRLANRLSTDTDTIIMLRLKHDSDWRRATVGRFRVALSSGEHSWPELGDSARKARMKAVSPNVHMLNIQVDQGLPAEVLRVLQMPEDERTDEQKQTVLTHFQWTNSALQSDVVRIAKLESDRARLDASIPRVLLTERTRPRVTRILPRGNFLDESGAVVEPAIPAVFGKVAPTGTSATRLDLANWIVSRENPLTARVFANRSWRQFFGTGISKVLEDLGSQGEWPSHPELLDWLAAEFTESWDVKHLLKTIVTSHTYRQSSLSTPQLNRRDPDNRLLARQSRYRVDAEIVHDIALATAGLLVDKFGGPSVRPYQPDGYLAAMNFPKREYSESRGDDLHRRALYTQWQRTFLHPSLLTFDAPTREECAVNRVNSNTPLQALVLLNDPIFVEASRVFAEKALASGSKFEEQIDWAFNQALNRSPGKDEKKILTDLYKKGLERNKQGELPAMTAVTRTILNLHETITRN
jgi:hypothetical protein